MHFSNAFCKQKFSFYTLENSLKSHSLVRRGILFMARTSHELLKEIRLRRRINLNSARIFHSCPTGRHPGTEK